MLTEGDVIELKRGHEVVAAVPKHFFMRNRAGCWDVEYGTVAIKGELLYLAGEYIVRYTRAIAAPTKCHPDYELFCTSVDDRTRDVRFIYRSGWEKTDRDVVSIRRAAQRWVLEDELGDKEC